MKKGMLIVFEGFDNSGKTSLTKKLTKKIQKFYPNQKVLLTRQPYNKEISISFKRFLDLHQSDQTDFYYFLLDRHLHFTKVLFPALNAGTIVVCDRFYYSSFVYQSFSLQKDFESLEKIHRLLDLFPIPDLVFFLNPSVQTLRSRLSDQKNHLRLKQNLPQLKKQYEKIFAHYQTQNHPIVTIGGNKFASNFQRIWQIFQKNYSTWNDNLKS